MTKIALYLRLSIEDFNKDESNSITNQRHLLNQYLDQSVEFQTYKREEFVDDGFSGTNLKRPAFQRLMTKVKSGEIRFILVKDFSRFMRDYIELGNYLENIFPFLGVRFIAINDQYDSITSENNGLEIDVSFKNLLNDFYAKDVSDKVKSAMNTMKRSGKNMSWLPPFGYLKDPNDRFNIIVDDKTAPIVKRIFALYLSGLGCTKIAVTLNSEGIMTPAERKMEISQARYRKSIIKTKSQQRNCWTKGSVRQILTNEAYKGTYLFNKCSKGVFGQGTRPESEWERIENNHEAIVSPQDFDAAQNILKTRSKEFKDRKRYQYPENVLRGYVVCERCKHHLGISRQQNRRSYYNCHYCRAQGYRPKLCIADKIEQVIFETISQKLSSENSSKNTAEDLIKEIEKCSTQKFRSFEGYKEENLNKEEYIKQKVFFEDRISHLEKQLADLTDKQVFTSQTLTREMIEKYVNLIVVDDQGEFSVEYTSN